MCRSLAVAAVLIVLVPSVVFAQGSIAGTVKDPSGAVLPGVTVEAASPALIEKTRSVVTDGTGQYKIIDLRPGTYTVTFTLIGFNTFKREGIELTGSFTATVNAELKVGAIEESVTVTGETPIVDIQSATRERVLSKEVVDAIPTGRNFFNLAVLVPGITQVAGSAGNSQDVGGSIGTIFVDLVTHGSHADGMRMLYNGLSMATLVGTANRAGTNPNMGAYQEVTFDTSNASAELGQGGVRMNIIPRDGGNTFKGSSFMTIATGAMQGDNFTQSLKNRGLKSVDAIKRTWDLNPGFGGPIKKDKLWFYVTVRNNGTWNYVPGMFVNKNANNLNAWTYDPDLSQPATNRVTYTDAQARITWQATPRNKFAFVIDPNTNRGAVGASAAPNRTLEAGGRSPNFVNMNLTHGEWTSPLTSRLLLEARGIWRHEGTSGTELNYPDLDPRLVSVTEQAGLIPGLTYRAPATFGGECGRGAYNGVHYWNGSLSYVSGAHAVKVGYSDGNGWVYGQSYIRVPYSYRFNNGTPNQITIRSAPLQGDTQNCEGNANELDHDLGLYAQDRWSLKRMTIGLGVRFDYYANSFPEQRIGSSPLAPTRNITFPAQDNLKWKDITPKFSVVYDLFGSGKTAIRSSLNKYVAGFGLSGIATAPNPTLGLVTSTTKNWTDANKNFFPDCNLLNTGSEDNRATGGDFCGAMANPAFGTSVLSTSFDPTLFRGWNKRGYDWEFSLGVQHQVLPRVGVDVGYYRRWFGNFQILDNLAHPLSDYDRFSIVAPSNPLLPGGGGYTVDGLFDLKPTKFGIPANVYQTFSDNYGNQTEHWNGVDVNVNARLQHGVLVQAGLSTGRTTTDNCEIVAKDPALLSFSVVAFGSSFSPSAWQPQAWCHVETPFLTQVKLLGSFTVPKAGVLVSGTFQSAPGPMLVANYNLPTAEAAQSSLGRLLAGNAPNLAVNIVQPGTQYGDRLQQLDLRFGKKVNVGRTRSTVGVDVYNVFNVNPVLAENQNYAAYRTPVTVVMARFAKVSWQFDF